MSHPVIAPEALLGTARDLAQEFARTAAERDVQGGTAYRERELLRRSGLLKLIIPAECGGLGQSWVTTLRIVRELAKADSSLAHLFSYHHLGVVAPHVFGTEEQAERYYRQTAENGWFWCNALNPLDHRLKLKPDGSGYRLDGDKSFCSGARDSDLMPVSAVLDGTTDLFVAVVPTRRDGIVVNDDWDNMGQRQTDSGSVTFHSVRVDEEEIIRRPGPPDCAFRTLRSCLTQINFANIYLGIAQGAFEEARQYTLSQSRAWPGSGVERAAEDPYILHHYGEFWVGLQAAEALADRAGETMQAAWEAGYSVTAELRAECIIAIFAAKTQATRVALDLTSRMFECMGARATAARYRYDRFWRNARTFTLHDPVDYKLRDLGDWALNGTPPKPSFYS